MKTLRLAFLALWCAALCLPAAALVGHRLAGFPRYAPFPEQVENRFAHPFPRRATTSSRRFGAELSAWYDDAFAWRTEILAFFRDFSFRVLKSPVGREVPGLGSWVFRRGGDWAELDDWLGALALPEEDLADWVVLLEGRREWARAHGAAFVHLFAPVKAQVRPDRMLPLLRAHRGTSAAERLRAALEGSPALPDALFPDDALRAAAAAGREVFYPADHHLDPYGCWLLYDALGARLRELFPGRLGPMPWYDEPPPDVAAGRAPGCWPVPDGAGDGVERLAVSQPGEVQDDAGLLRNTRRFPYSNVATTNAAGGISVLLAHDSMMRFSLASWRGSRGDVRFPLPTGVGSVKAYIFQRYTTGFLDSAIADGVPDAIVEQFPECRLGMKPVGLDRTMRNAAAHSRAALLPDGAPLPREGRLSVLAVLERVSAGPGAPAPRKPGALPALTAALRAGGREIARAQVYPGVRRAVFFGAVDAASIPAGASLEVSLRNGSFDSARTEARLLP